MTEVNCWKKKKLVGEWQTPGYSTRSKTFSPKCLYSKSSISLKMEWFQKVIFEGYFYFSWNVFAGNADNKD